MDNQNFENMEKVPEGGNGINAEKWGAAENEGWPPFAGENSQFGTANETNEYYGEQAADNEMDKRNDDIADAAALINYGDLNAAARKKGVEYTVQVIKNFDTTGREDPIKDLYAELGITTKEEKEKLRNEASDTKYGEEVFRESVNAPSSREKSVAGAFVAIDDMKELIREVEGADPRYRKLREGAMAAGKGYFEYATSELGTQDLVGLFNALAAYKEDTGGESGAEDGGEKADGADATENGSQEAAEDVKEDDNGESKKAEENAEEKIEEGLKGLEDLFAEVNGLNPASESSGTDSGAMVPENDTSMEQDAA